MWRPSGWTECKLNECMYLTKGGGAHAEPYATFEAGADAMLSAITDVMLLDRIGYHYEQHLKATEDINLRINRIPFSQFFTSFLGMAEQQQKYWGMEEANG